MRLGIFQRNHGNSGAHQSLLDDFAERPLLPSLEIEVWLIGSRKSTWGKTLWSEQGRVLVHNNSK